MMRFTSPLPFEQPTCDAHGFCRPLKKFYGSYFSCEEEKSLESSYRLIHRYGQVPTIEDIDDYLTYEHSAYFGYLCERNREQPFFTTNRYASAMRKDVAQALKERKLIDVAITFPEIIDDACGGTYVTYAKSYITHAAILNGLRYFPQAVRDVQSKDYFDRKSKVSKDAKRYETILTFTPIELQVIDRWGLRGYCPKRADTLRTLLLLGLGGKYSLCAIYGMKTDPKLLDPINTKRLYEQTVKARAMERYFVNYEWSEKFYKTNGRHFLIGYDKPYYKACVGSDLGNLVSERFNV